MEKLTKWIASGKVHEGDWGQELSNHPASGADCKLEEELSLRNRRVVEGIVGVPNVVADQRKWDGKSYPYI